MGEKDGLAVITWWKSHRWSVVAIAVLAPIALLVAMSTGWFRYEERVNGRPVVVAQGERVDYAGAIWTLEDSTVIHAESQAGREAGLVEGLELVVANVRVNPSGVGGVGPTCEVSLEDRDGRRTWDRATASDVSAETEPGTTDHCSPDDVETYLMQVMFLVPQGAGEGAHLVVKSGPELPRILSFTL